MKKSVRRAVMLVLAIMSFLLIVVFDQVLLGVLSGAIALMVWGWFGNERQEITVDARDLDPKDVKEYRRQHKGATVVDAINALGRPSS